MSDTVNSPNMSLPIPIVSQAPGPDWATDLNICLGLVDSHDHSAGSGVQITPAGLSMSSDLPMLNNNITGLRSLRLNDQGAPLALASDLRCLYSSGVDLYFNDGNGNQIQITQSGGIAGTPGSISNLTPPASASYVAGTETFVWQSDVNTPANLDAASVIIRKLVANGNGITLSVPAAIASDYTLTLPPLPVSQKFMTLDASGNITAPWSVDGSTIVVAANVIQVPAGGITTTQIAALTILGANIANGTITENKLAFNIPVEVTNSYTTTGNTAVTIPTDVSEISLEIVAGGGGGGGTAANNSGNPLKVHGGGGGQGAAVIKYNIPVSSANSYTMRIGTGGTGGTAGSAGGTGGNGVNGTFSAFAIDTTVTISNATPAVLTIGNTSTLHVAQRIFLTTSGALPTGLSINTIYFISTIVNGTQFRVSATLGGADINTSSAGSGTHTLHSVLAYAPGGIGGVGSSNSVSGTGGLDTVKPGSSLGPNGGDGGSAGPGIQGEDFYQTGGGPGSGTGSTGGGGGGGGSGLDAPGAKGGNAGAANTAGVNGTAATAKGAGGGGGGGAGTWTSGGTTAGTTGGAGGDGKAVSNYVSRP